MGNEDTIQQALALAPPNAPTAADAEATKTAATAQQLADSLTPKVAAPQPAKPATAPEAGNLGARPGSFAQRIGDAFNLLSKNNVQPSTGTLFAAVTHAFTPPEQQPQPSATDTAAATKTGPWATALASDVAAPPTRPSGPGRVNDAVQGILRQIGDIKPAEGGVLGGFAQTARVGSEREEQEKKDRVLMSHANAQMLREQALTHKAIEDEIQTGVTAGKAAVDTMTTAPPGGESGSKDFEDLTVNDLNAKIKSGEIDPTKQTPYLTGRRMTGKDKNGIPTYESTYTVVTPPKQVLAATDQQIADIKKYAGVDLKTENDKFIPVSGVQFNALITKASAAKVTERQLLAKEATEGKAIADEETRKAALTISQNPTVQKVLNMPGIIAAPNDPYARVKAFNLIMNRPDLLAEIQKTAPNFADVFIKSQGGNEAWKTQVEAYEKAQAKNADTIDSMLAAAKKDPKVIENHTSAYGAAVDSVIKNADPNSQQYKDAVEIKAVVGDVRQREIDLEAAKAKAKKEGSMGYEGDPNATTPAAFLASLEPNERALVSAIGTNRIILSRLDYLATRRPEVLDAVTRSFPDFNSTNAQKWPTVVKDFTTTTGKTTGAQLLGGSAALKHLSRLMEINDQNPIESRTPGRAAYQQYQNLLDTVTDELSTFYNEPKTNEVIQSKKKTLAATFNRDAAIKEQAKAMGARFDSFQETWENGFPSPAFRQAMPNVDLAARQARAKMDSEYATRLAAEQKSGAAPTGHKVGDTIMQGGHRMTVTAVDPSGRVIGAE